ELPPRRLVRSFLYKSDCPGFEDGDALSLGNELVQELQPLGLQFVGQHIDPREIVAGAGEAGDETELDWVFANDEYDRDGRCCSFGRERMNCAAGRDDHATCRRTRSAITACKRSYWPCALWYSTVTFSPST